MGKVTQFLIQESTVATAIGVYAFATFLDNFPGINQFSREHGHFLFWVEYVCTLYFVIEAILKIREQRVSGYWENGWNRFDFIVVVVSLPFLLTPFNIFEADNVFATVLILRTGRLLRLLRLLRFIPNGPKIWLGIKRSLKASVGVFLALLLLNLMFAMGAAFFFKDFAPEHFGDPLSSAYTLFKVFTVEGWYEIPDLISERSGSEGMGMFVRGYFVVAVVIGGILGLSLANAVFVDEMTADNTVKVEMMVEELTSDVKSLHTAATASRDQIVRDLREELQALRRMIEEQGNNRRGE